MTGEMSGVELGGELNKLRTAARVELPRMADEYHQIAADLSGTAGTTAFHRPEDYFGPRVVDYSWSRLRDLVWNASDNTAATLVGVGSLLGKALDDFVAHDAEAAQRLDVYRNEAQNDSTTSNDEYTGQPSTTNPPAWSLPTDDHQARPGGPPRAS
ncbi:MAG TPA: hypothetical protein VE172_09220 [Stackebrandtia sp.]|uniref:hypothetical protein n=1 Tax=Stackebrandtia sp. TaxID=2023065 RepID=UPI002D2F1F68|nr:hypothetical protein [Stackebrandtia sp.]HZE38977.1 hypothetical protein [Stackebrandtia sp.]